MAKQVREVEVVKVCDLSPNYRRMTLGGDAFADFPCGLEGGYIKLVFPRPPGSDTGKPVMRSFTVREFDPERRELDFEYVAHGDAGPAGAFTQRAAPGDRVTIAGPGAVRLADGTADWFLIAGDMTALPAIAVNLEQLPSDAVGHVVVEVLSGEDRITLDHPPGMTVHWVINPPAARRQEQLAEAVEQLPWADGSPSVWMAGEFDDMRRVRRYCRERNVSADRMYVSSYWKVGATDEGMKAAKKADAEA